MKGAYIKISLLNQQPVEKMLEWCKGLKLDSKAGIIIFWNHQYVSVNSLLPRGQLVSQYKELTEPEEKILDVLVFTELRYFLTATGEGNIYVWKYMTKGRVETHRRLIHTFTGHFKAVPSICQHYQHPNLVVSVSIDATARIWSLDTF